jgi:hypothetical protein
MKRHIPILVGIVVTFLVGSATAEDKALTNADVVALVKAELGTAVVVAKVKQAPRVAFDLGTDDLIRLKKDSVPQPVIEAMLERATSASAATATAATGTPQATWTVRLMTPDGPMDLARMQGSMDNGLLRMGTTRYHNFPGAKAKLRIRVSPSEILVATQGQPAGQYFVVKADSVLKKNLRSVKVGHGFYGMTDSNSPDPDWTFQYSANEVLKGIWALKLAQPLPPGEYGVYVASANLLGTGELYDFAVD